jgi:hypothetical protein
MKANLFLATDLRILRIYGFTDYDDYGFFSYGFADFTDLRIYGL